LAEQVPFSEAGRVEPRKTHNLAPDANDRNDPPSLEKPAGQNPRSESLVAGTEAGGSKQQPLSDSQIGRLQSPLALQGNGGAPSHPAVGPLTECGLIVARGPDGAVSVEALTHPHQVTLHITKAVDQDKTAIRIELDPSELGEVDIDLEFRDLRLTATVRAERSDVLDLLQRDVRTLARALREAGVELAESDISFSHSGRGDHGGDGTSAQRAIILPSALVTTAPIQDVPVGFEPLEGFVSLSDGRMDLRV
jgi:flagellar hook-length control protein FliK